MISTTVEALSFIKEYKVVTLSYVPDFPSLINEIAGTQSKGVGWVVQRNEIWLISEEIKDSPSILTTKMVFAR